MKMKHKPIDYSQASKCNSIYEKQLSGQKINTFPLLPKRNKAKSAIGKSAEHIQFSIQNLSYPVISELSRNSIGKGA